MDKRAIYRYYWNTLEPNNNGLDDYEVSLINKEFKTNLTLNQVDEIIHEFDQ